MRIISGGETGADRAALDFAIEREIPHGGWCPKGRLAEDGVIDERYQLRETSTRNYPQRTEKNILDSDGTIIVTISPKLTGGCKETASLAQKHQKPWVHLHARQSDYAGVVSTSDKECSARGIDQASALCSCESSPSKIALRRIAARIRPVSDRGRRLAAICILSPLFLASQSKERLHS
jgi:putative molybdenum carrier protein